MPSASDKKPGITCTFLLQVYPNNEDPEPLPDFTQSIATMIAMAKDIHLTLCHLPLSEREHLFIAHGHRDYSTFAKMLGEWRKQACLDHPDLTISGEPDWHEWNDAPPTVCQLSEYYGFPVAA